MKVYYCSLSLARKFPAPATVYGGQVLNCSLCSSKFRSNQACEVQNKTMGRAPCCDKTGIKKGPWTPQEDQILIDFIRRNGHGNWRALPKQAGLLRCGKSCRLRWINYLRPDIKHGNFSSEEEEAIIKLHQLLGNRWSAIASRLPGRTDNEIKNVWNTHLKKRLLRMGIDPVTHAVANHSLAGQSLVSLDFSEYSEESPSMKEDNLGLIQAKTSIDSPTTISNFSDTFYDSHNLSSEILSSINSIDSEVRSGDSSSSLDWVQSSCINSFDEPLGCNQQPPAIEDDTFIFGIQDYASEISTHEVMWEHSSYGKAQYFMSASPEDDFLSSMGDADTNPHLLKNLDLHTIGDDSDGFGYWLNVLKQVRPSPVWM